MPENLKKSWSSHQLLILHLNTITAILFIPALTNLVKSKLVAVKLSAAYPTYSPFTQMAKALSTPSKVMIISLSLAFSEMFKVFTYIPTGLKSLGTPSCATSCTPSQGYCTLAY